VTGGVSCEASPQNGFHVRLSNFEGPFDLLLQLIFAHRLDVTEVALHQVTDEFIAYTRAIGPQLELDETTAFLVVAATLLDLKAARLLPSGQVDDEEDLALLEVRDLLFARLLQYRAFKHVAQMFAELEVSVPEQAEQLLSLLETRGIGQWASFSELVADCQVPIQIVGRFLALLELYRSRAVAFDQSEPLGVLQVSWTGERPTSEALLRAESQQAQEVRDQYS